MNPIWIKRLYCVYINLKEPNLENGAFDSSVGLQEVCLI